MAVERKISTRLVLEGEKEYKSAVANINREYRLLQSELKLVDSQFAGQKNTLAALEAKHKALNDVIANQVSKLKAETDALQNSKNLQTDYAKKAEEAKAKLESLAKTTDDATKETQEYKDKVAELEKEFNRNIAAEKSAAEAADKHAINANKVQVNINQLNAELSKNDKYLDEAKASADGCATSIDEMGKEAKETAGKAQELGDKGKQGIEAVAKALAAAGVAKSYHEIAEALEACVTASIDFESAMAGVSKTTGLTGPKLATMGDEIKELSLTLPITSTELANIAEIGAQLGIPTDKLVAFVKVMANLSVATNLTSEESATMLSQFANVTQMDTSKYENLGSAVVALGNNFATNEKNIVEMSQRLAAAGTLAGLTEPDILALATAMSSVGIQADAGGTAMTQTLTAIEKAVAGGGEALTQFASIAGMTAGEFATTWQTAPMEAIQMFLQGLGDLEAQGGSATLVLEEMGLSGVRQSGMLKSLSLASDQVTKATTFANKAWKENNALTKEAETRYATTDSKVKLFNNSVTALKISIGDQLTPALGVLAETGADVVSWAAEFVEQNEWLGPAIMGVVAALGALAASVVAVTVVIPALKAAWAALQGVMGPIGWISLAVGAIAGLASGIAAATSSSKENIDSLADSAKGASETTATAQADYQKRIDEIDATNEKADSLVDRLSVLEAKATEGKLDASEWREWNDILSVLVETVPELSQYINLQTGEIVGGAKALQSYVSELDNLARREAAKQALSGYYTEQAEAQVKLTKSEADYTASYNNWQDKVKQRRALLQKLADTGWLSVESIEALADSGETLGYDASTDAAVSAIIDEFNALSEGTYAASQNTWELGETVKENQTAFDAATASLEANKEALYAWGQTAEDAKEKEESLTQYQSYVYGEFNTLKAELDSLTVAYEDAYNSALQSIEGITSGFNAIEMPEATTIEELIKALNSQNIFLDNYSGNLVKLEEIAKANGSYGTEAYQTLFDMLSDGSAQSASYLDTIVQDNGENWDMLLTQVSEIAEGKKTWATVVAGMQTDFETKAAAIEQRMAELAAKLDQSAAAGEAIDNTMSTVNAKLEAGAVTTESIVARINAAIAAIGQVTYTDYTEGYNTGEAGSHAAGLPVVPYDGSFNLHEGELVLTKLAAKAYRAEQSATYDYPTVPAVHPIVGNAATAIDYDRLGASVAAAMEGFGINMDGVRVAELQAGRVSQNISNDMHSERYS